MLRIRLHFPWLSLRSTLMYQKYSRFAPYVCVIVFYFNKCNLLEQFLKNRSCAALHKMAKKWKTITLSFKKWHAIKDNWNLWVVYHTAHWKCVCVCGVDRISHSSWKKTSKARLGESGSPRLSLWFSPAFVALVTTNRKTGSVRRLSWERKLLRLLCRPQNDWVLGLFQLLHRRAATAGESEISTDVRSVDLAFCTAAMFDVNVGVKPVFRVFPLHSQSC